MNKSDTDKIIKEFENELGLKKNEKNSNDYGLVIDQDELNRVKEEIETRERHEKEYFQSLSKLEQEKLISQMKEIIWETEEQIMNSNLKPVFRKLKQAEMILEKYKSYE